MKAPTKHTFCIALGLLAAFALWTAAVRIIDVQAIGPGGSCVGFAVLNRFFHNLTGVHMSLYVITDWLGLVPIAFALGFAVLGLAQWMERKHLTQVDRSIFILGGFYLVVMAVYALFELVVVNYRPVLMEGFLEASYPSSTTLLVLTVMPTAMMQLYGRIKHPFLQRGAMWAIAVFIAFMLIGRLVSGVHWLSDIIGGVLLSSGLVLMYHAFTESK